MNKLCINMIISKVKVVVVQSLVASFHTLRNKKYITVRKGNIT